MSELTATLDALSDADLERLPSAWDERVTAGVREFADATRDAKRPVREAMTRERSWALMRWANRMATLAVRLRSPQVAVLGLVGLSLHRDVDVRDALVEVALLRRAAALVGEDPPRLFDAAAELTDEEGAAWLAGLRDSPMGPADMGYVEQGRGDDFTFRRAEPSWDPEVELKDVLDPDHFD
jgi:hypothetical protein